MSGGGQTRLSAAGLEGVLLQGCYLVEKRVAKGGMAWVYYATHQHLDMPVAIKVLFDEWAVEESISERFLNEARIQFKLKHNHIVRVTDVVEERGILGMVMEWVEGEDLQDWLSKKKEPVSLEELWLVMSPVLEAMSYIHGKNMVHRDLKPANIMLVHQEGGVSPKVVDFGIAKVGEGRGSGLTQTGTHMGTLKYMSPEQIRDTKHVDHRADIYSLGIIFYELLCGQVPFDGQAHAIMYKQLEFEPEPIGDLRPGGVPKPIEDIVFRCLEKKAEDRFDNCLDLFQSLGDAISKELGASVFSLRGELSKVSTKQEITGLGLDKQDREDLAGADTYVPSFESGTAPISKHLQRLPTGSLEEVGGDENDTYASESTQITLPQKKKPIVGIALALLLLIAVPLLWFLFRPKAAVEPAPRIRRQVAGARHSDGGQGLASNILKQEGFEHKMDASVLGMSRDGDNQLLMDNKAIVVEPKIPSIRVVRQKQILVRILSKPLGAGVYSRPSVFLGRTPLLVKGFGKKKKTFILKRKGFHNKVVMIRFSSKRSQYLYTLSRLKVPTFSFRIESTPSQANVVVSSKVIGRTPFVLRRKRGEKVRFFLRKRYYSSKPVDYTYGRSSYKKNFRLERVSVRFRIGTKPTGVSVFIGGRLVGKTPYQMKGKAGLSVRFTLKKNKYDSLKKKVLLLEKKQQSKLYILKKEIPNPFAREANEH